MVSEQIYASLYRLRIIKGSVMSKAIHGRKSIVGVGGKLGYPELELFAGEIAGNKLYEDVERETEARMRIDKRIS
jgi:hypothetical protein